MDGSERYGVLTVTVVAVFIAAVVALLTRNAWTDTSSKPTHVASAASTTLTVPAPTTTLPFPTTTTTIAYPTTTAPRPTTPATRATIPPPTAAPLTVPPPATTVTTTAPPPQGGEERSENTVTFTYGPTFPDRSSGTSRTTGSGTTLSLVVSATLPQNGDTWDLGADVINKSNRTVTFTSGIDVVMHFTCNGQTSDVHLHDANYTSAPPTGGVRLHLDHGFQPKDAGPSSCEAFGTLKYN